MYKHVLQKYNTMDGSREFAVTEFAATESAISHLKFLSQKAFLSTYIGVYLAGLCAHCIEVAVIVLNHVPSHHATCNTGHSLQLL